MADQPATREDLDRVTAAFSASLTTTTTTFINQISDNLRRRDRHKKPVKVPRIFVVVYFDDMLIHSPTVSEQPQEKDEVLSNDVKVTTFIVTTESQQEVVTETKVAEPDLRPTIEEIEHRPMEDIPKPRKDDPEDTPETPTLESSILVKPLLQRFEGVLAKDPFYMSPPLRHNRQLIDLVIRTSPKEPSEAIFQVNSRSSSFQVGVPDTVSIHGSLTYFFYRWKTRKRIGIWHRRKTKTKKQTKPHADSAPIYRRRPSTPNTAGSSSHVF